MMRFQSIVVVLCIAVYQANSLTIDCTKSDDGTQLTATLREAVSATAVQIEAFDVANPATDDCSSTQVTVDGVTTNELIITVSLTTELQISPTIETSNCYVTAPTAPATLYTYHVVTQRQAGTTLAIDTLFSATCDSTISVSSAEVPGGVPVANILTATAAEVVSDSIAASLVDNTGAPVTAPDLGDLVSLRVTFTVPTGLTAGTYAQLLQIYNVELSGYSDFRTSFNLITENGCTNATAVSVLGLQGGVVYNPTDSTVGTTHVSDTGLFTAAMFEGPAPKTMYVKFSYRKTCLTITDMKCTDQQQYCVNNALTRKKRRALENDGTMTVMKQFALGDNNALGRKKRSTALIGQNGTLQFGVPISFNHEGSQNQQGGNSGTTSSKQEECEVPEVYWIISIVLGFLLLCMMALCVFLVLRLRKEQNRNDRVADKLGHGNPGYRY
ncbi:uncharacterized protein LOC123525072 [Mercenaria mercenaria]|uniref:uncharacterized protein LOC123525072 n=1 Tax=Mercenaria mercenaria TaxID=6596 RepID=UPI00234E8DE0|nr:uncharacterized protein LOC123525072 [Mercenaria mercenaria]